MDRLDPEIGFLLEKQQVEFTYFEPEGAVSDEISDPNEWTRSWMWKSFLSNDQVDRTFKELSIDVHGHWNQTKLTKLF